MTETELAELKRANDLKEVELSFRAREVQAAESSASELASLRRMAQHRRGGAR